VAQTGWGGSESLQYQSLLGTPTADKRLPIPAYFHNKLHHCLLMDESSALNPSS
jgi:hypothetical protein